MPNIGSLNLIMGADSSGFNTALDKGEKKSREFANNAAADMKRVAAASPAAAAAQVKAQAASIVAMQKHRKAVQDEVAKMTAPPPIPFKPPTLIDKGKSALAAVQNMALAPVKIALAPIKLAATPLKLAMAPVGLSMVGIAAGVKFGKGFFSGLGSVISGVSDPLGFLGINKIFKGFTAPILDENGMYEQISQTVRSASRLGMAVEDFITLKEAFGGSIDAMSKGLIILQRNLSGTQLASEMSAAPLAHFGIDLKALSTASPVQQLKMLADRHAELASGIDRTALKTAFFGRGAFEMDAGLRKIAGGGLESMRRQAIALNKMFSAPEAQAVLDAQKAAKQIDAVFKGVQTQFTLAFAPIVADIGTGIADFLKNFDAKQFSKDFASGFVTALESVVNIAEVVSNIVIDVANFIDSVPNKFDWKPGFSPGMGFAEGIASKALGTEETKGKRFTPLDFSPAKDRLERIKNQINSPANKPKDPAQEAKDLRVAIESAVAGATLALGKQHAEIASATDDIRDMWNAQRSGASYAVTEMLKVREATRGFAGQIEELTAKGAKEKELIPVLQEQAEIRKKMLQQNMFKEGISIMESVRTPLETNALELRKFQDLLAGGALDWETYRRAVDRAGSALEGASNARAAFSAGEALSRGSSAAISAINREKFGGDTGQKTDAILKQTRDYLVQLLQQTIAAGGDNKAQVELLKKLVDPKNALKP